MLAKMGMSLAQCNQKYLSMDYGLKERLFNFMATKADRFGLENVIFPSFVSQAASRHQYSASDVVHSIAGLLEVRVSLLHTVTVFPTWQCGNAAALTASLFWLTF
jgi:cell division control protein 45